MLLPLPLLLLLLVAFVEARLPLRFGSDGAFTVVQFADLHFGEAENTEWGPAQDHNSTRVMRNVLNAELKSGGVDLVVFSGDQLTGNNIASNATAYWAKVVSVCVEFGVAWAILFGNHDDAPLQPTSVPNSVTTRHELMAFDVSYPNSYSQFGPSELHGVSNYALPIYAAADVNTATDDSTAAAVLYFLDSGGGSYDEQIFPDQVLWFRNLTASAPYAAVPGFVFVHIPDPAYTRVTPTAQPPCFGMAQDDITPTTQSNGFFDVVLAAGTIGGVSVGHDHGNDWCCPFPNEADKQLSICYGRHSGYGGYGSWARGARVFQFTEQSPSPLSVRSWVRMEDGSVIDSGQL